MPIFSNQGKLNASLFIIIIQLEWAEVVDLEVAEVEEGMVDTALEVTISFIAQALAGEGLRTEATVLATELVQDSGEEEEEVASP